MKNSHIETEVYYEDGLESKIFTLGDQIVLIESDGEPYRGPDELPYLDDSLFLIFKGYEKDGFAPLSYAKTIIDEFEDEKVDYSLFGAENLEDYIRKNPEKYETREMNSENGPAVFFRVLFTDSEYYSEHKEMTEPHLISLMEKHFARG